MKRSMMFLAVFLFVGGAIAAATYTVEAPKVCQLCKMDRTIFDYSRMIVEYSDGTTLGVCSLHCAVAYQMKNQDKVIKSIKVADLTTKELIDARTAVWVVGGKKKGVMTSLPKWAFAREQDAKDFIKENGGEIVTFDKAWKKTENE
jgi:nitrous oxide reductase accessory protein NosL